MLAILLVKVNGKTILCDQIITASESDNLLGRTFVTLETQPRVELVARQCCRRVTVEQAWAVFSDGRTRLLSSVTVAKFIPRKVSLESVTGVTE